MQVQLLDAAFPTAPGGGFCGPDVLAERPRYFEWDRQHEHPVCFFTDSCLDLASKSAARVKVAMPLESPALRPNVYEYLLAHEADFTHILTYVQALANRGGKWRWRPAGGTMIAAADWQPYPKTKLVSLCASFKTATPGHRLRHAIAARYGDQVDVLGSITGGPAVRKLDAMRDYAYTIVVEQDNVPTLFTDKLLDALACGTVPLYWGPDLGGYFAPDGIIPWRELDELGNILPQLSFADYARRRPAARCNLGRAWPYRCPEDWLWEHYPDLFREAV